MILIASNGSIKTGWYAIEHGQLVQQIFTKGTNPFFQSEEEINNETATALIPQLKTDKFEIVHFYGAGCIFPDKIETVRKAITTHLQVSGEIEVSTDMLTAVRGLYGHQPGITRTMGTGPNSCYYDGKNVVSNMSPLGFILGDEGSGAVLGKLLVGNTPKNQVTPGLKEEFLEQYSLIPTEVAGRIYRRPLPNCFLASFSPFLIEYLDGPVMRELILNSFEKFPKRNVVQYDYQHTRVHFIGLTAFYYKELLSETCETTEIHLGTAIRSPMEELIRFHEQRIRTIEQKHE